MTARSVVGLSEVDATQWALVGGKGANLGELSRIEGISVPMGFCVTTDAFRRVVMDGSPIDGQLDRLSTLNPQARDEIRALSAEIRHTVEGLAIPGDVASEITAALVHLGDDSTYAVRSSATAEDLPAASFAGQHDTYLNLVGPESIVGHVGRCWASLFTERAVTYRRRNGIDHRQVHMGVVVQRMVFAEVSGILFTADPGTGHRKVSVVEASFGLGEALVAGLVNADSYKVRDGRIFEKTIGAKRSEVHPVPGGATRQQAVEEARQVQPALSDAQVVRLEQLGRRVEAHFGSPQDIEWCLVDDDFRFVQSRPITTLFPVPKPIGQGNRVYISVGHQQMMTDPMKPLGISMWQLTTPAPATEAGGRLFVDATARLASPAARAATVKAFEESDPLIGDALQTVLDRGDFIALMPDPAPGTPSGVEPPAPLPTDPAIVDELIEQSRASIAVLERDISALSGPALFEFIAEDLQELKRILFDPRSHHVFTAAMDAASWLNDHLFDWLGVKNAADVLTRSVPHNVTSEMGLALLDVADVIRPYPDVVAYLHDVDHDDFLDDLALVAGGREAREAISGFLDTYGMRCVGEIDITRPRWSERPTALLPVILGNVENFEPGAAQRRFESGRRGALAHEQVLLERLRDLPEGERRAEATRQMIHRVRTFIGYREYPKYGLVRRYAVYKQALLREAQRLRWDEVIGEVDDIFYLTFGELHDVVRTNSVNEHLIAQRKDAFVSYRSLTPPRVITSDGEIITGRYRRDDLPPGALVGLAVSVGTIEGRARVIHDPEDADLEPGDILVTTYTDPSWTPVFVTIAGLVTEVGGLMTHGAVIAREFGLPAVVGVEGATRLIGDGQRIRVNGTDGHIQILT